MYLKHVAILLLSTCLLQLSAANSAGTVVQQDHNTTSSVLFNRSVNRRNQLDAQSESETAGTKLESQSNTSLKFDEEYKALLSGESPATLDLLNDSAEVDDAINDESDDNSVTPDPFDELVLPSMGTPTSKPRQDDSTKNVYKVPKLGSKKYMKPMEADSMKRNGPTLDYLLATANGNSTQYENHFHAFISMFDHYHWNVSSLASLSRACARDISSYLTDLMSYRDWAIKASDASGRYRGQFFFDNDFWLGSKQFCYEINREFKGMRDVPVLQFFVVKVNVKLFAMTKKQARLLHVGQCLPKSCATSDISLIMNNDPASDMLKQMTITSQADRLTNEVEARANELSILDTRVVPGDYRIWEDRKLYVFGTLFIAVLALVVFATVYESMLKSQGYDFNEPKHKISFSPQISRGCCKETETCEMNHMNNNNNNNNEVECDPIKTHPQLNMRLLGFPTKVLLCFAYGSNSQVILSTRKNNEDSLTCIHGLRLFSLLWTILVHTYLQFFGIGENKFNRKIAERTFIYQVVGNATFSVDTFFFISGLLVVLLFLRTEKAKRKKNGSDVKTDFWCNSLSQSCIMVFYRFLRLTPIYIIIIALTELALKTVYNDSVFTPGLFDHITCQKYWWRNILYINNFYPLSQICLMWSWYLSNDFQFYIVAIFLLILSTRYLKLAVFSSMLLLVSSWILSIYMSLHFKYMHKVSEPFESFDFLYDKPWQRFGPYAIGMITGYILYRNKKPPKVHPITNVVLWILSLLNLLVIVFGVMGGQLSLVMTSLYVSFGHTAWGVSLMWLTLSCCWKLAKPINSFLSFSGFFPLSRLTYCTYLIHPTVMMITSFQCEAPLHLRHGMVFTAFLGNAVISFLLAFVLSIMFEAPVIRLLKLYFRK